MRELLLILLFLTTLTFVYTQEEVYSIVEKMPVFETCEAEKPSERFAAYHKEASKCSTRNLDTYLEKEIAKIRSNFPAGNYKSSIQFIVETDGSLSNIKVKISSGNSEIDTAALSIVQNMPQWEAGTQRNAPVRVLYLTTLIFD